MKSIVLLLTLCACLGAASNVRAQPLTEFISGTRGIHIGPEGKAVLERMGQLQASAEESLDAHRYASAEIFARQALEIEGSGSGVSQELLAQSLYAQGKMEEAFHAYHLLHSTGGGHPRNELPYALLLLKQGRWLQALDTYTKTLPYLGQGELMRANNHFTADMPQPVDLATSIHIAMGINYNATDSWGRHSQDGLAINEYHEALLLEPDSPLANYYYGFGLQRLEESQKARAAFLKAVKFGRGDVKVAAQKALKDQAEQKKAKTAGSA